MARRKPDLDVRNVKPAGDITRALKNAPRDVAVYKTKAIEGAPNRAFVIEWPKRRVNKATKRGRK